MTDSSSDNPLRPFSSVFRARIAWNTDEPVATLEELQLEATREAAFAWQSNRNQAEFFGFFWLDEAVGGFVREIHGLFGSSGELVLSSLEAAAEVEVIRRAMAREDPGVDQTTRRVNRAGQWRALRFFAEAQANNLMVFGHGVANLTLRTLALQPGFDAAQVGRIDPEVFRPESDNRGAWCSLSGKTAGELRKATQGTAIDSIPLVESLADLWNALEPLWFLRGTQYHRWRGESPGVTGINFVNPNHPTEESGTITRTLRLQNDYVEGEKIVNEVVNTADAALRDVGAWMPKFLDAWGRVFNASKEHAEETARLLTLDESP